VINDDSNQRTLNSGLQSPSTMAILISASYQSFRGEKVSLVTLRVTLHGDEKERAVDKYAVIA